MSQSYVKECIFCHQAKIRMSDKSGKWLPYNQDGSVHECKPKQEQGPNGHNGNDLSVGVLLKKLETLGIKIDLSKLRLVQ